MDAILFSAVKKHVDVDDAIRHLGSHEELYWSVSFPIRCEKFFFPILGFIHIGGGQVEYKAFIKKIISFSPKHYEDPGLAPRVKPEIWIKGWKDRDSKHPYWKNTLVITSIEPFSYDTYELIQYNGNKVKQPPQKYIRIIPPLDAQSREESRDLKGKFVGQKQTQLAEVNLEEFIIHQLDEIESGLTLEGRQLSTEAGRLDLLCKDRNGHYVVVELKRTQGTDQVIGQILRYMGWVQENYQTEKVRGIIVVAKKDKSLFYAIKTVPNIQVKEFIVSIK